MDLQLLQKELNLSPYIQYNICHHLIPGLTQLSTLSAVVDGGKASLSAVVLFRHVAVHSIDQILRRLQMLEDCYCKGSIRLTRPQPVFLCREVTSGKQPIKETRYETMHLIVLHKSKPFLLPKK